MVQKERRRNFFINKALQLRYMLPISLSLIIVTLAVLINVYSGVWAGVLDAFSDEKIQNDLLTATRIEEYEKARLLSEPEEGLSTLSFFRQAERLSQRQREVFKEILAETNRSLVGKLVFLFILITIGTIFLSHKIAGPLYRFEALCDQIGDGQLEMDISLRENDQLQELSTTHWKLQLDSNYPIFSSV
jgi:nitrogen fixation/metabolism regulation signal transduction histidine kinase